MTSLESIVLPLATSRALVEHGIVLDTALYWFRFTRAMDRIINDGYSVAVCAEEYHAPVKMICPAPTLSELLDALRETYPDATISTFRRKGFGADVDIDDDLAGFHKGAGLYPTDILAAAALLMEMAT